MNTVLPAVGSTSKQKTTTLTTTKVMMMMVSSRTIVDMMLPSEYQFQKRASISRTTTTMMTTTTKTHFRLLGCDVDFDPYSLPKKKETKTVAALTVMLAQPLSTLVSLTVRSVAFGRRCHGQELIV